MPDRSDPPQPTDDRGPWPIVNDRTRLYDPGWPWCANAASHPDFHNGYPDPNGHTPPFECRSREAFVDARMDVAGPITGLSAYVAAEFRFGERRATATDARPRIVIEAWPQGDDPGHRVSVTPGDALLLAHALTRLAHRIAFNSDAA